MIAIPGIGELFPFFNTTIVDTTVEQNKTLKQKINKPTNFNIRYTSCESGLISIG